VSVIEGQSFLQVVLVFGVIGLIGLVMRWALRRRPGTPQWPADRADPARPGDKRRHRSKPSGTHTTSPPAATSGSSGTSTPPGAAVPGAMAGRPMPTAEATAAREDYGLLTVIADLGSAEEAARARVRLGGVGIRATTAVTAEGRHRILVFGRDAMRGRRALSGH
jgi:hypothetical protein